MSDLSQIQPDRQVSVREVFGIDSDMTVPAFSERDDHVPEVDAVYRFNPDVTLAILAGFTRNRRVMVQGLHGTGKINPHRAGRGAPQLAMRAGQPRRPHQPSGPCRQGCHRVT
jgi:hypothetical protein